MSKLKNEMKINARQRDKRFDKKLIKLNNIIERKFQASSKNISSETKSSKEMLFILEIYYGGIFQITNIPGDQLHPYLLIECPRILFPYLRRIISDITRDGGYPPINLDQIDFLSMYKAELDKRAPTNSKIN